MAATDAVQPPESDDGASLHARENCFRNCDSAAQLFNTIARRFEPWRHARLSRELRDQPYVLILPRPPTLMS